MELCFFTSGHFEPLATFRCYCLISDSYPSESFALKHALWFCSAWLSVGVHTNSMNFLVFDPWTDAASVTSILSGCWVALNSEILQYKWSEAKLMYVNSADISPPQKKYQYRASYFGSGIHFNVNVCQRRSCKISSNLISCEIFHRFSRDFECGITHLKIIRSWRWTVRFFFKFRFLFHLKNHHSRYENLKFQMKLSTC